MKKKDIIALVAAAAIFLVAGYLGYTQLAGSGSSASAKGTTQVEVIGSIPSSLDATTINMLNDPTQTVDFKPVIDLSTGLGTSTPFGG